MFSHLLSLNYKHIVPTGLKRVYIPFFYKHFVPTGLKRVSINEENCQDIILMSNSVIQKVT